MPKETLSISTPQNEPSTSANEASVTIISEAVSNGEGGWWHKGQVVTVSNDLALQMENAGVAKIA